jgi:glutathione peroxidase-family protein
VNGKEATPLYKFLKSKKGGFLGEGIKWNFTKFLVDKDGKVVERYAPTTSPLKIEVCKSRIQILHRGFHYWLNNFMIKLFCLHLYPICSMIS